MTFIKKNLETEEKLSILSKASQYDLACACATGKDGHRRRSKDNKWIYPVTMQNGRTTFLFKTLLSNECTNNCKYCPLRVERDPLRVSLTAEETSRVFLSYYRQGIVNGLFLSSGVTKNPDFTMERINAVAAILRRSNFKGYIHLKIIPGSSEQAISKSLSLATAVSLNIETAGEKNFKELSTTKNYTNDIMQPIRLISKLTRRGAPYYGRHQTTQFVIGAARETDKEIINSSWQLYKELKLNRIYFSAYQRGSGALDLYGENSTQTNNDLLNREHRLYQADWLMRKYGFSAEEIPLEQTGNLSLTIDPKELWAKMHPEFFPVNINRADKFKLLRVPGLGLVMVNRIISLREAGYRVRALSDLGRVAKTLSRALPYITF